jgi:phosphoribosylformylglycinamidine synthase subunit PurL
LGQSLYASEICGVRGGQSPKVDLSAERNHGEFVRRLIAENLVTAVHDVSDGGLLVCLAEMALAGNKGFTVSNPSNAPDTAWGFGEDQARYVITTKGSSVPLLELAGEAGVGVWSIGTTSDLPTLRIGASKSIDLADLRAAHEGFFPKLMGADAALA